MSRRTRAGNQDLFDAPIPGDVLSALGKLGIEIVGEDSENWRIPCPAHLRRKGKEDRNPSCYVHKDTGVFLCFSCAFKGPFVRLAEETRGQGEDDAVQWVSDQGVIDRAVRLLAGETYAKKRETEEVTEAHLALFTEPPAKALASKGITAEAADRFEILWDPKRRLWIFPVRDEKGKLLGWQEKGKGHFLNFPEGMQKGDSLFGLQALDGEEGVLVESPIDIAVLWAAGIAGGLASYGAILTPKQFHILGGRLSRLVDAHDNDHDGKRERRKVFDHFHGTGLLVRYFDYGDLAVKDPGEMTPEQNRAAYEGAYHPMMRRLSAFGRR
ncbi:toprim domain-containing protein [Streptomyces sp. RTd22]|uniref:toprim domain-containing protein n=1 Tax=Streptomyces sp. RTd22 TaxID=1841249 RepID=UPI0007C541C2|nr:toprim domain-containing protein [Streptomyces sp. RTd22]